MTRSLDRTGLDASMRAHLCETKLRVDKALEAGYLLNANALGGSLPYFLYYGLTNGVPRVS